MQQNSFLKFYPNQMEPAGAGSIFCIRKAPDFTAG